MSQQHAVITGGTGSLGRAVVAHLLEQDVACHVTWKSEKELDAFPLADRVMMHRLDCADERSVVAFYDRLHRIDASIHLVGGFAAAPVGETTGASYLGMFELNALTAFLCSREAIKKMRGRGGGRIVNVAARPAVQPAGGMVAYATAKAAVAAMTQCLAEEVRQEGLCVNAVLPSVMDTPGNRAAMPDADFSSWPKPAEVAAAIAFLAGPGSKLTSGALLPVYGRA